jgi:murein L,D-transpeptidase YcbB/YkuD
MFPNKHNVYLHDTPARNLFSRSYRALSHGCVRLAEPISFAEEVLANKSGWSRDRIDAVLASRETTRVNLDRPLPVHLIYATAWLEEDGLVHFRADIYGRDKRLYRALFAKHTP